MQQQHAVLGAVAERGGVQHPHQLLELGVDAEPRLRQGYVELSDILFGAALGTIVWLSTGEFVFWVIFMGGGMVLGLAIGSARAPEQR